MKLIEPPDIHYMNAARGWMGLGDLDSACEELEKIAPELCNDPRVLELSWEVYSSAGRWSDCVRIATRHIEVTADSAEGWLNKAYALRRAPGGGLEQAKAVLLATREKFPDHPLVAFNLGCYDCCLGNHKDALNWIEMAVRLAPESLKLSMMAVNDPDLEAIWPDICKLLAIE